jgi:type VI secretion system protein ImpH
MQAFLNIFHHRMALLFYRAWSSARPAIQRDRPWQDRYSVYVGALSGYGLRNARHRDRFADESKWFYSGRLASIRRNAEGLQAMLAGALQCPVEIKQFQLRTLPIDQADRTRLGRHANCLGQSTLLGSKVPDRQSCVEVQVGPLNYHKFENLLPGAVRRQSVEALVRNYTGLGVTPRMRLVLKKDEVPKLQLGVLGTIGRNAWLSSRRPYYDATDCCTGVASA